MSDPQGEPDCPSCGPTPDDPRGGHDCTYCGRLLVRAEEGVDHRDLLRKYILHTFASEPTEHVSTATAAAWIGDWLEHSPDFTAEEKAELVRLASEGEESVDEIGAPHFPEADGPERY